MRIGTAGSIFQPSWRNSSSLIFTTGEHFVIQRKGCWRPDWDIYAEDGQKVLSLNLKQKTAEAAADSPVPNARFLSLLIMFVLYRSRQIEEEAAATMAATVAVIASS